MSRDAVVVIGAGWAGLAAATRLAGEGVPVIILERAQDAGGRAGSFFDRERDEWLDNGPHVFIGAYTHSLGLLRTWKASGGVDFSQGNVIPWLYKGGKLLQLKLSRDRLGALGSLMTFRGMSMVDRVRTVKALEALAHWADIDLTEEQTVAGFLKRYGIKPGGCGGLWDALTLAVMNAPPHLVGVRTLVSAVKKGLMLGGEAGRIGLPRLPFKQLYIDPALKYLGGMGVEVRLGAGVKSILIDRKGEVEGVKTSGGDVKTKRVVATVQPLDLLRMLPGRVAGSDFFKRFKRFEYASIAGVHYDFDRPVLPVRYALLPGAFTHWIFGRGLPEKGGWPALSAVVSSAPRRSESAVEVIAAQVLDDLKERLPAVRQAQVQPPRVVRTARATVVLKPGSDALRPESTTPVRGLFLAGDWCGTGLPATIESAALSGGAAADACLAELH